MNLERLKDAVAARVLMDALDVSRRLANLGIPHALIGGLAVGMHALPRATKEVDFLVDESAFEVTAPRLVFRPELREIVKVGVVDLLLIPDAISALRDQLELPTTDAVPVIAPSGLVALKLDAWRPQDRADVASLLGAGLDVEETARFLRSHAPHLAERFETCVEGQN